LIRGSCHCGAVKFRIAEHREFLTDCNCSTCRRYGSLWLHADRREVVLEHEPDATLAYEWGDRMLAFHSCRICGCTTHWLSTLTEKTTEKTTEKGDEEAAADSVEEPMAVNCRMAEPADIADLPIRHFDGADTWRYLD
jgi:hypothetical protein